MAAGFSVHFSGSSEEVVGEGNAAGEGGGSAEEEHVEEDAFCNWLYLSEMRVGSAVAKWWTDEDPGEEGALNVAKQADDETAVDLFARIKEDVGAEQELQGGKRDGRVTVRALLAWLQRHMGSDLGLKDVDSGEMLVDQVLHELSIAAELVQVWDDRGCMEEPVDKADHDDEAVRTAERLVYGWPSKDAEPTRVVSPGRFAKSFPLDFPMGIGDLYQERPHKVSVEEWVQHLLRYRTGHFVGGLRGQRVVWAMVNTLLLSEARSRGFGVCRNVLRRVGVGLEGGRVLTKGALKEMLKDENRTRVLVNQLMTVGRDVRSTSMQWAYEGKKLDATVKHLSWVPPWVEAGEEGAASPGRRFLRSGDSENPGDLGDVEDDVGLGRFPSVWWTLNCKYNAAYDIHRMNAGSKAAAEAVAEEADTHKQERFLFVKDSPDLVSYMLALRTELHMRIVMPAVVPYSEECPFLAMSRVETGVNGNLH